MFEIGEFYQDNNRGVIFQCVAQEYGKAILHSAFYGTISTFVGAGSYTKIDYSTNCKIEAAQ